MQSLMITSSMISYVSLVILGKAVWEDIHPDSKDFVKDYLAQYPEVS